MTDISRELTEQRTIAWRIRDMVRITRETMKQASISKSDLSLVEILTSHFLDLATETAAKEAAITDAEATIAALTQANADLAQDNARMGKRVEGARLQLEVAYIEGAMDVHRNYRQDRSPDFTEAAMDYAARAWLAGGDAE